MLPRRPIGARYKRVLLDPRVRALDPYNGVVVQGNADSQPENPEHQRFIRTNYKSIKR